MTAAAVDKVGSLLVAWLKAVGAPGVESAPRRNVDKRRRRSLDGDESLDPPIDDRDRFDQTPRIGMQWL